MIGMPDIRYVCISDTHFGADNSLLTNLKAGGVGVDPSFPSPVLINLVACLRKIIASNSSGCKPTLILNGDILELALSADNMAAMAFERFMELAMPAGVGDRLFAPEIIFIPGNHDHHLWETAREMQYLEFLKTRPPGTFLQEPWHGTNMLASNAHAYFLETIIRRHFHLRDVMVTAAYPNFGLVREYGRKLVVFSHGHYTETIYTLMTTLADLLFPGRSTKPRTPWDLEAENFAWVDFFWSMMGRSGAAGPDVEFIYDKLQDPKELRRTIVTFVKSLLLKFTGYRLISSLAASILRLLLWISGHARLERSNSEEPLSEAGRQGVAAYFEDYLRAQLAIELKGTMPIEMSFIFGHTHKPFEGAMNFQDYPQPISVYNSGGWVVDQETPQSVYGGAVILLDDDLNAVSLRMFNQAPEPGQSSLAVRSVNYPGAPPNPFAEYVGSLITPHTPPWSKFSDEVARQVVIYRSNLEAQIRRRAGK
jgi:hypothetical protein